jgi:hypothetical protein
MAVRIAQEQSTLGDDHTGFDHSTNATECCRWAGHVS